MGVRFDRRSSIGALDTLVVTDSLVVTNGLNSAARITWIVFSPFITVRFVFIIIVIPEGGIGPGYNGTFVLQGLGPWVLRDINDHGW